MQPNHAITNNTRTSKTAAAAKSTAPELTQDTDIVALSREVQTFPTTNVVIKTPEQYQAAGDKLKRIKAAISQIEDKRVLYTKPLNDTVQTINKDAADSKAPWLQAEAAHKNAMIAYTNEQLRIQREEQRKAEEKTRKDQERLNQQAAAAAAAGKTERAEQLQERASTLVAPVINRAPPKVAGISIREVWKFRIKDITKVPREYLMLDETKVRGVVNSLKGDTIIEGLEVYQDQQMAAGAA